MVDNRVLLTRLAKLRSVCLIRLADVVTLFQDVLVDDDSVEELTQHMWPYLMPLLDSFASSVGSSSKAPALLKLFHAFAVPSNSRYILQSEGASSMGCMSLIRRPDILAVIIHCAALSAQFTVYTMVMEILLEVFAHDEDGTVTRKYVGVS